MELIVFGVLTIGTVVLFGLFAVIGGLEWSYRRRRARRDVQQRDSGVFVRDHEREWRGVERKLNQHERKLNRQLYRRWRG